MVGGIWKEYPTRDGDMGWRKRNKVLLVMSKTLR